MPNSTSATALPASVPGCHASRTAGAESSQPAMMRGRLLTRTTTNGLPVAAIAVIRFSCASGSVMSLREPAPRSHDQRPGRG